MTTKKPLRAKLASSVSRGAAALSRATGRGDGSVIGGRIGLMIDPNLLANLAAGREIALISGTNGKTTTTRLTTAALGVAGPVATNSFGANMPSGHTSALARAGDTPYAVLEVDEHYLPEVLRATKPKVVALLNLSRDQLDRAKEVAMMAQLWRDTLAAHPVHVVANADDPMITWAARAAVAAGGRVTWVAAGQRWHDDSWVCPECGAHIERAGIAPGADPHQDDELTIAPAGPGTAAEAPGERPPTPTAATAPAATAGPLPVAGVDVEIVDLEATVTTVVATDATESVATTVVESTVMLDAVDPGTAQAPDDQVIDEPTVLLRAVPAASRPTSPATGSDPTATSLDDPAAPLATAAPTEPTATPSNPPPVTTLAGTTSVATLADAPDVAMSTDSQGVAAIDPADLAAPIDQDAEPATVLGGDWWCTGCTLRRPTPQWYVDGDDVVGPDGRRHTVQLALPGRVNRANAATALAVATEFGVDPARAAPRLAEVASIAGRYAQVERDGRAIRLLLAKNPAGWLEAFDMAEDAPTLLSINSRDPDGLDTSWLFDVDFSPLAGRQVLITGERAYDLAVRLEVNDVPFMHVKTFAQAVAAVPPGRLEVIANYTAFQDIRAELDRVN